MNISPSQRADRPSLVALVARLLPNAEMGAPLSTDFADCQATVVHLGVEEVHALLGLPAGFDIDRVLRLYKSPVMCVGACMLELTEGILDRALLHPHQAASAYDKGAALEFDCVDEFIPELRSTVRRIGELLGVPAQSFTKSIIYAAKNGGGFPPHFDAYTNIVFQLRGQKDWFLLSNGNVEKPLEHYELSEQPYLPSELSGYWTGPAPDFEETARRIELNPGDVLLLPRGCWHGTSSSRETLSCNVTFSVPTWLELLLVEFRRELAREATWRGQAYAGRLDIDTNELGERLAKALARIERYDAREAASISTDQYQESALLMRQLLRYAYDNR